MRRGEVRSAWLFERLDRSRFQLRVSAPLRLRTSEPEPDIAVSRADRPRSEHPGSAELIVEVAASSHFRGLQVKPDAYASATGDYWVIDLRARRVICHRDPSPDGFRSVETFSAQDQLLPLALGIEPPPLSELFAAAE